MKILINFLFVGIFTISIAKSQVEIPHVFRAGEPAKAEEVNSNFTALKNAIEKIPGTTNRLVGNVGIGTDSPNAKLSLGNDLGGTKLALYDQSNENMYGMGVTAGRFSIHVNNPKARFSFLDKVDGEEIFTIQGTGRVGIMNINPNFHLHVNGTAGKPGGGTWSTASDARLKDIHEDYTKGMDHILKLTPVYFNYKNQNPLEIPSEEIHIGLVAQEVLEVIPEAVGEYDQEFLSINSDPIILAMLNAIKELNKENNSLKNELETLKAEIKNLKDIIENL